MRCDTHPQLSSLKTSHLVRGRVGVRVTLKTSHLVRVRGRGRGRVLLAEDVAPGKG